MGLSPFPFSQWQTFGGGGGGTEIPLPYLPPSGIVGDYSVSGLGFTVPTRYGMSFVMPSGGPTNDVSQLSWNAARRNVSTPFTGNIICELWTAVFYPDDGLDTIDAGWVPDTLLATSGSLDSTVYIPASNIPQWHEIPLTSTVTLTPGTRYIQVMNLQSVSGISSLSPWLVSAWTTTDTAENICEYQTVGHPSAPLYRPSTLDVTPNRNWMNTRVVVVDP